MYKRYHRRFLINLTIQIICICILNSDSFISLAKYSFFFFHLRFLSFRLIYILNVNNRFGGTEAVSKGKFLTAGASLDYFSPDPYKDEEPGPTYVRPVEIARKTLGTRFYVPFPKKPGGSHDGCFSKFPEYTSEPYVKVKAKAAAEPRFISGGPFLRSKYTNSIIAQITKISCNASNYSEYRERAYPIH